MHELQGDPPETETGEATLAPAPDHGEGVRMLVHSATDGTRRVDVAIDDDLDGHTSSRYRLYPRLGVVLGRPAPAVWMLPGDPLHERLEGVHGGDRHVQARCQLSAQVHRGEAGVRPIHPDDQVLGAAGRVRGG